MELDKEIETLKKRLEELEASKRKSQEYNEKIDVGKNLDAIKSIFPSKDAVEKYYKQCAMDRRDPKHGVINIYGDEGKYFLPFQAIYNILHTFNERLDKLESKKEIITLNERLDKLESKLDNKDEIFERAYKECLELSKEYDVSFHLFDFTKKITYFIYWPEIITEPITISLEDSKNTKGRMKNKLGLLIFQKDDVLVYSSMSLYITIEQLIDRFSKFYI